MRREDLSLVDIVEAADTIGASLGERSVADFMADADVREAVLLRLIKIGEAAARLPSTVRQRYSDVPWADKIAFHNRVVHAYFAVDWFIAWGTGTGDVPSVRAQVADILDRDYRGSSSRDSEDG